MTALAPLWLLAYGPLLLGVPHLLADARYLVARPRLHARPGFWVFVAVPLALTFVWPQATTGLCAVIGAALLARGSWARRGGVLVLALAATAFAATHARLAGVALAHLHNMVAIAIWFAWAPRGARGGWRLLPLGLFVLACAVLFTGGFDAALHAPLATRGLTLREMTRVLSPVSDPSHAVWAARAVLFFAFSQSVHYAIWLRLVPEEDRPRPGLRSFAASARALVDDTGWLVPLVAVVVAAGLVGWGLMDPHAARLAYLRVAIFSTGRSRSPSRRCSSSSAARY